MALSAAELRALERQRRLSAVFSPLVLLALTLILRWRFGYTVKELKAFRADLWEKLSRHRGPLIWAANHHTLIDSFLIVWAVLPLSRVGRQDLIPWSTPEYRNYYMLGGFLRQRLIRGLMYLCRCIPFLREGEDSESEQWRQKAFEKCAWVLGNGGAVFVYPEAGRSRKGWLEPRRPKDFLGRLSQAVPAARFLCVYLRSEGQLYATVYPPVGVPVRAYGDLLDGAAAGESARDVSQRLFNRLAELQEQWFSESALAKNCGGNDVVDLGSELTREHFEERGGLLFPEPEWLERHLTEKERRYLSAHAGQAHRVFWKFIAAKEAAHKALAQSGIQTPAGAYTALEADLFLRRVLHRPTGAQVDIAFTDDDEDKVHCLAVLRGGFLGDDPSEGDVLWRVEELPPGRSPSDYARERCLSLIAESSDDIPRPECLAFTEENGVPRVLHRGRARDWGVSLSHSGRFVAYSFMTS